jgi:hypothetical protein
MEAPATQEFPSLLTPAVNFRQGYRPRCAGRLSTGQRRGARLPPRHLSGVPVFGQRALQQVRVSREAERANLRQVGDGDGEVSGREMVGYLIGATAVST